MDDLTALGHDGIRRSFDEHYGTMMDVEQDPTGAMWAIHKQADRIKELEATLSLQTNLHGEATYLIEELEAKLAKAVETISLCRKMQAQFAHTEDPLMVLLDTTLAELKGQNDE